MNNEIFNKKVGLLWKKLSEKIEGGVFSEFSKLCGRYAAFISVSDIEQRAYVFRASGDSPKAAWENVRADAAQFIYSEDIEPLWVKADITVKGERVKFEELLSRISGDYNEFFRRGIAFDDELDFALIEAEINGGYLINYKKKTIELPVINKYLADCDVRTLTCFPDEVILFDCVSEFCDEKYNVYELYSDGYNCGRRVIPELGKDAVMRLIATSSDYLSMQIGLDGKFDYGYYPIFHKEIPGYNILRHASSIWCLLCSYRLTGDRFTLQQAESAINYLVANTAYKYPNRKNMENTVYLFESTRGEVKIGGNAVAIVVLCEYMDVVKSDRYKRLVTELGNGILELFDERSGSFFHVLRYPTLAPRDKFRTVYYDGETVFALCKLYGLTHQQRFLDTAKMAVDRFIEKDYTRYADHWVAYAMNEFTKYMPEEKYLNFALDNVSHNLRKIYDQPTSYHTYLELLCVSFEMYSRIIEEKRECSSLKDFDEKFFIKTIFRRAEHMLNGYGYPEYVMYFKYPSCALGSFFVRHDDFRIRIDDVQHFCGAYYSFHKNYDKIKELSDRG